MKKIYIIISIIITFIFSSCEPKGVKGGRDRYMKYFNNILKDPSSLVIYNETYKDDPKDQDYLLWEVDYGAKNSFGGMVRNTYYFRTYKDAPSALFSYKDEQGKWQQEIILRSK